MRRPFAVVAVVSSLVIALVAQTGAAIAQPGDRLYDMDYKVRNYATEQFLDSRESGEVYTNPDYDSRNQEWTAVDPYNGVLKLCNVKTGMYLDSRDTGEVYTNPYYDSDNQLWRVTDRDRRGYKVQNVATGM